MPRRKAKRNKNVKVAEAKPQVKQLFGSFPKLNWNESYVSLFLGLIVVFLVGVVVFSYFNGVRKGSPSKETSSDTSTTEKDPTYTVIEGDWLSTISLKFYGNPDDWKLIADENKIKDPNNVETGTTLRIPEKKNGIVTPTTPMPTEESAPEDSTKGGQAQPSTYVVKEGDSLWNIAVAVYGDGYRWPEIQVANNIPYPDYIYSGMSLVLPK